MNRDTLGLPTILLPYPGPASGDDQQDIFVFLRPETNGVIVESTILRVIKKEADSSAFNLVYMANIPGEFIVDNKIVEQYYSLKLHFAAQGREAFSASMQERFSAFFNVDFASAPIVGSFEALKVLNMSGDELFQTWVPPHEMTTINGQSIKKVGNYYVVNYDMPAILHKNYKGTDIAVMMFRTNMDYGSIKSLVAAMWESLVKNDILHPRYDSSRAFHHSKSPIEQTLDAVTFLVDEQGFMSRLSDFTFPRYLLANGIPEEVICGLLMNPIVEIREESGAIVEDSFFTYSNNYSYAQSLDLIRRIVSQRPIVHHTPLIRRFCRACLDL